ncbi:MAG: ABC transporter permease subunit [bacterium]|nr:ABC transporter permease subunit [bacterium]
MNGLNPAAATLAQGPATEENPPFWDNATLDSWEIPFGSWMDEMIDWIILNFGILFDIIEWPFSFLFRNFVDGPDYHPWWEITDMSWILVCGGVLVVGIITRNVRVGFGLAVLLALCGLLGNEFWEETTTTIGLIGVAVALCVIIGIPVGIVCGRVDGVWRVVRPILDAMQVVHAFVYIIPFIFFFGLGPEPATIVTMVFAVPPLIRLTNLGIRQVPADVVEASRAYGASEVRVLFDVQLPLARTAIMTGINQTLLLAISMIGIAAIMGASGLGLLVYRAVLNLDTPLSTSSGLGLFIVAVVLDRLTQTEAGDGTNLFARIRQAWVHRRDPEALLDESPAEDTVTDEADEADEGTPAAVGSAERAGVLISLAASLLAVISIFLPWGHDAGHVSAYGRAADLDLSGSSFNGLAAEGGSFFGMAVLAAGLVIAASALTTLTRPGRVARWFGADGALISAAGLLASAGAYVWIGSPAGVVSYSHGIGAWVALGSGIIAVAGAVIWTRNAPYSPLRPLPSTVSITRIAISAVILALLVVAGLSSWSVDERAELIITPEVQAELDRLKQEAQDDPSKAAENATQIAALSAKAQEKNPVRTDGFSGAGPRLGYLTLWLGVAALLLTLPAAGLFGRDEQLRWRWSIGVAAVGVGVMLVAAGWISSLVRVSDPNFVSGPGAFLCLVAGFLFFASARGVLREFQRTKVYQGEHEPDRSDTQDKTKASGSELAAPTTRT